MPDVTLCLLNGSNVRPVELHDWIRHDSTRGRSMCEWESVFGVLK